MAPFRRNRRDVKHGLERARPQPTHLSGAGRTRSAVFAALYAVPAHDAGELAAPRQVEGAEKRDGGDSVGGIEGERGGVDRKQVETEPGMQVADDRPRVFLLMPMRRAAWASSGEAAPATTISSARLNVFAPCTGPSDLENFASCSMLHSGGRFQRLEMVPSRVLQGLQGKGAPWSSVNASGFPSSP